MSDLMRAKNRLLSKAISHLPGLGNSLADAYQGVNTEGEAIPWASLVRPLNECRVSLVTTAGVHLKSDVPFDMKDPDGDPTYRTIPSGAAHSDLTITHDYYDHSDALRDLNIVFPDALLHELAGHGEIGGVGPRHFTLMGHITGAHIGTLINTTAPAIAASLAEDAVEAVLMTPG